jgi:TetR/AcrR family transcriptional repressor of nem operon
VTSKKEEIICKASSLIHSKGYENTKLSDILKEAEIGKGQFYHYFTSKRDLGEAVIDYLIYNMSQALFNDIFDKHLPPKEKFNQMLNNIHSLQTDNNGTRGCPIGNLAIEISEHDPVFREKVSNFFDQWEEKITTILDEIKQTGALHQNAETEKKARSIVAMIEGGLLLMKNRQDIEVLNDILDVIRNEFQL